MMDKKITWTNDELKEFERLVGMSSSRDQMARIDSRIEMPKFVKLHGKEKCDAMWKHITGEIA